MASTSSKYTTGPTGLGSSSAQTQQGLWSYAVPSDEAAPDSASQNDYHTNNYVSPSSSFRQPLSQNVNGTSRPKTRRTNKSVQSLEAEYAASGNLRPPASIHDTNDTSGATSEADSLLDLYKSSRDHMKTSSRQRQDVKRKESLGTVSSVGDQEDVDSKWIHRDKLAQIESRELLAMRGQNLSTRSRSRMGKQSSKAPSVDVGPDGLDEQVAAQDAKRQRTVSPTLSNEDSEQREIDDVINQSQNASPDQSNPRLQGAQHGRRPSTSSKIPVTKGSGATESTSPIQTTSPNQRIPRTRSGSQTSQDLLNAINSTSPTSPSSTSSTLRGAPALTSGTSPSQSSPPKTKLPSKTTPPSAARAAQRSGKSPAGQARPTTASGQGNGTSSRPGTSSGPRSPEGDPPWISTMYKPDPRLPPDQQMLPTHAKRLAQEQGQQPPMMYETSRPEESDFMLLDSEDSPIEREDQDSSLEQENVPPNGAQPAYETEGGKALPVEQPPRSIHAEPVGRRQSPYSTPEHDNNEWPLRSPSQKENFEPSPKPKSEAESFPQNNGRSGTPVLESGYSLMPTIHSQKEMEQRLSQRSGLSNSISSATPNVVAASGMATEPIRVPDAPEPDEKEEKKKGSCACCIVM